MFFWSCPEKVPGHPSKTRRKNIKAPSTHVSLLEGLGAWSTHRFCRFFCLGEGFFWFLYFSCFPVFFFFLLFLLPPSSSFFVLPSPLCFLLRFLFFIFLISLLDSLYFPFVLCVILHIFLCFLFLFFFLVPLCLFFLLLLLSFFS